MRYALLRTDFEQNLEAVINKFSLLFSCINPVSYLNIFRANVYYLQAASAIDHNNLEVSVMKVLERFFNIVY